MIRAYPNGHANEQLKINSFVVLKDGEWQPETQVVVLTEDYTPSFLIGCTDEKVLISESAGKISVYNKKNCKIIPLKQDIKVRDG